MKIEIKQTIDGEWQMPPRRNFYRSCCYCGLTHKEEYRIKNGKIQYRVWRDVDETQAERDRIGLDRTIQKAIFAALGCTTIDYKSPAKLDGAATQITRFVLEALNSDR